MAADIRQPVSKFVEANGIRHNYLEWGDPADPPLVMMHGIGLCAQVWNANARDLSRDYRVICPDLRGHGDTDKPGTGYTFLDLGADIAAIIHALGLESPFRGGPLRRGDGASAGRYVPSGNRREGGAAGHPGRPQPHGDADRRGAAGPDGPDGAKAVRLEQPAGDVRRLPSPPHLHHLDRRGVHRLHRRGNVAAGRQAGGDKVSQPMPRRRSTWPGRN